MAIFNLKARPCVRCEAAALYSNSNVYPQIAIPVDLAYINLNRTWRMKACKHDPVLQQLSDTMLLTAPGSHNELGTWSGRLGVAVNNVLWHLNPLNPKNLMLKFIWNFILQRLEFGQHLTSGFFITWDCLMMTWLDNNMCLYPVNS